MAGERDRFVLLANSWLEKLSNADRDFVIQYLLRNKTTVVINSLPDVLEWSFTGENVIFNTTQTIFQPGILSVDYGFEDLLVPVDTITAGPSGGKSLNCIKVSGTKLYVGGDFTAINGITANGIAQLDLNTGIWSAMGSGLADTGGGVLCIDVDSSGNVYAGGAFNQTYDGLAVWGGSSWSNLGVNNDVYDMYIKNDIVYICGDFSAVNSGATAADRCAKYAISTTTWTALDTGITGILKTPFAICVDSNNYVYIGGVFSAPHPYFMRWTGAAWDAMGSPFNYYVYDIRVTSNDYIYVGGHQNNTNMFQLWNPSSLAWSVISGGFDDVIYAIEVLGEQAYIGGEFETPAVNIAKCNGLTVSTLTDTLVSDGTSTTSVNGIDIDTSGNVYICGYLRNSANSVYWYVKKYLAPSATYSQDILGYTAEDVNLKSTNDQMSLDSDILYPSQSAVRDYAPKKKVTTTDPTVNDDVSLDYRPSDLWINTNG